MAQFNINITQGSAPYTISIKAFGDNTERWISGGVSGSGTVVFNGLTGNNNYNVSVSSNGCTTGYDTFPMNCVIPTPVANNCQQITNAVSGNTSEFSDYIISVPSTGNYRIDLTYTSGESPTGIFTVNGVMYTYTLPTTGSWTAFTTITVVNSVNLNTGNNTIRVSSQGNGAFIHNKICAVSVVNSPTVPSPVISPTSPVPSAPSPSPVNNCNLSITNITVTCNAFNDAQITVIANNPNGYNLEYQIDNYILWQSNNVFNNIANTGTGYTIRVRNRDNVQCEAVQNTVYVDCITSNPTPVTPTVPNSPTPSSPTPSVPTPTVPSPTPVNNCNLSITGVNVTCVGDNNGTVVVSVNNPNNYSLQYQIDNYISWQQSNTFNNITNTGTGYTVRVRDANNTSCEAVQNTVYVDCHSVPTPVTPTPTPISPTPVPSVPSPTPVGCNGITNLTIYGSNVVTPNSQNSYTSSYSGDAPYSYSWNISGQGTSVIGANNGDTATFQFGSSNGTITLTVTNCGGTYSVEFPFSQSEGVVIKSCDVVFNGNSSPDIYKYDVATDTVSVIGTTIGSSDVAMTDTKLWVYGSDIIHEYNITKNPFTINFNRNISFNSGGFGAGLVAINDTTLVTGANTIRRLDISGSTAVETSLFDLPSGSIVTGDIVYKSSTDTYIITYHNNVNRFVGEFSPTGTVLKSGVIGISAAYGIIAVSGSIYLCNANGDLYLLNESNYTISFAKNIGSNISGFSIAGATQSNGCY